VPLLYVIREADEVDDDEDPGWYEPNLKDDLALRGPHGDGNRFWDEDNSKVWDMLLHCLHPTKEYASIKSFAKKLDGHGAYIALKDRMMGTFMVKSLEAQGNHVLLTTKYTGQSKGFTFDRFVSTMEHAFNDCGVAYTENQKVTILLKSIAKTTLGQTQHAIKSCKQMKNNFSEAVAYLMEELASRTNANSRGHRNVSSFGRGGRGKGRGGRGGCGGRGSGKRGGGKK
jgi:hypothetical protein